MFYILLLSFLLKIHIILSIENLLFCCVPLACTDTFIANVKLHAVMFVTVHLSGVQLGKVSNKCIYCSAHSLTHMHAYAHTYMYVHTHACMHAHTKPSATMQSI